MAKKPLTKIERAVLGKLVSRKVWGRKHISENTLLRCGWKGHEKGSVKQTLKNLINMNLRTCNWLSIITKATKQYN